MACGGGQRDAFLAQLDLSALKLSELREDQIARLLNRAGKPTGRGNGWTQARVRSFRSHHGIAVHRPDEWAERAEISLEEAAQIMDVSVMTALGDQSGGCRRISCAAPVPTPANSQSSSAELRLPVT